MPIRTKVMHATDRENFLWISTVNWLTSRRENPSVSRAVTMSLRDADWASCGRIGLAGGLTAPDRLEAGFVRRFRSFYPMYTVDYRERLGGVYQRLKAAPNLVLTGRVGMFNYNNSDHCLDMGRFIAQGVERGDAPADIWTGLEDRVRSYRIVD